jgi:hypothetical protein
MALYWWSFNMALGLSKISANALYANASTVTPTSDINRDSLGLSIFDSNIFEAANGWITLKANSASWAPGVNLVSTLSSNVVISGNATFAKDIQVLTKGTTANSALRLGDLSTIGADLLITAIGSLDMQFTVQNIYTGSVDQPGTPNYISNFVNPQTSPPLNNGAGTSQVTAPYILGNATSLGVNYTVINTQYGSAEGAISGGYAYGTSGTVTMVIDIAKACGLENNKFLPDGVTINPAWKGNYKFDAFSSLFKMKEYYFWDYVGGQDTFEYSVNMIPQTNDFENVNYGKYNVSSTLYASASYHSANLGARWMGIATKIRNIINF